MSILQCVSFSLAPSPTTPQRRLTATAPSRNQEDDTSYETYSGNTTEFQTLTTGAVTRAGDDDRATDTTTLGSSDAVHGWQLERHVLPIRMRFKHAIGSQHPELKPTPISSPTQSARRNSIDDSVPHPDVEPFPAAKSLLDQYDPERNRYRNARGGREQILAPAAAPHPHDNRVRHLQPARTTIRLRLTTGDASTTVGPYQSYSSYKLCRHIDGHEPIAFSTRNAQLDDDRLRNHPRLERVLERRNKMTSHDGESDTAETARSP